MPMRFSGAASPDKNPYNWRVTLYPYVRSTEVFRCPSNPESSTSATDTTSAGAVVMNVSYACNYNSGTGLGVFGNNDGTDKVNTSMIGFPSETIAVAETTSTRPDIDMDDIALFGKLYAGHAGLSNYLFCDGHARPFMPLQTYFNGNTIRNMWQRDHSEFSREEVTP